MPSPSSASAEPAVARLDRGAFPATLAAVLSRALGLFAFEYRGEPVGVDGMRLRRDRRPAADGSRPRLRYEEPCTFRHSEPRIELFVDLFTRIAGAFEFCRGGTPVEVDAVRLVNLRRWARYPYDDLLSNLSPITTACSARCVFCYRKGSLNGRLLGMSARTLRPLEAETRAKYWRDDERRGLPVHRADLGEAFSNRWFFDILEIARRADPGGVFSLTTNGDFLDRPTIERLKAFKPLVLAVSINSADAERRSALMRPRNVENGLNAPALLREAGIPFVGSIVADQRLDLPDIERTIRHLDAHEAVKIRVLLPGYTRYSAGEALPGLDEWWDAVAALVTRVRRDVETPLHLAPAFVVDRDATPVIDGLFRDSVARKAGLRIGDAVLEVDGREVFTKTDVIRLLEKAQTAARASHLRVRRNGATFTAVLAPGGGAGAPEFPSPDDAIRRPAYGVFMNQGLEIDGLAWIRRHLAQHRRGVRALLFTTPLAHPHVQQLVSRFRSFGGPHDVRFTMAEHEFWGGNIKIGDLHVVSDYVRHIERVLQTGWRPDVAFIPASFLSGRWGLDMTGTSYRRIERETGVRTLLVPVTRIME